MKLSDFIFQYPCPLPSKRDRCGMCRVRLFLARDGQPVALLTEVDGSGVGPSVTNEAEHIVRALIQRGHVPPECRFIEHYERSGFGGDTFDILSVSPSGQPSWEPVAFEHVVDALGCAHCEIVKRTLEDARLAAEVGRIRQTLNPRIDLPNAEETSIIQRKLEIEASMLSRSELLSAVQANAGEREMQRLIRKDLSLLGEIYAMPTHEYICFAEFPIADGFVDFLVLTGRSRMDIFLVEIKGADFNLINSGTYPEFNARINRAAGQIRRRYRAIYEALPAFRRSFHDIRSDVEAGRNAFHSFLGPHTPLEVDPDKDVNIYGVVIGGRMRDSLLESHHRHDYEWRYTPRIRVDSWDSWLNRLQRE